MKAYQRWAEKPITRGNYVWMSVLGAVSGLICGLAYWLYVWEPAWWTRLKSAPSKIKYSIRKAFGK